MTPTPTPSASARALLEQLVATCCPYPSNEDCECGAPKLGKQIATVIEEAREAILHEQSCRTCAEDGCEFCVNCTANAAITCIDGKVEAE